jgi:phospholipid/cholesterol/gamma-HCH transport system substrate-binding protein
MYKAELMGVSMSDRQKSIWIGIFVTGVMGIAALLILFLKPSIGDGKQTIHARFTNILGISKGTRVIYAGRPIGHVVKVQEIPEAHSSAVEAGSPVYSYQLTLRIDSSVHVYLSDELTICTNGLMGERSVAIIPRSPRPGESLQLIQNEIMYASYSDPVESGFKQVTQTAAKAEKVIDHLDLWLNRNADPLAQAALQVGRAAHAIDTVLTTIENQNIIPSIKESTDLVSSNLRELHNALDNEQLLTKLSSLITALDEAAVVFTSDGSQTLSNLNVITNDIIKGNGTLGRILHGDDLYLRFSALMSKSEMLMNDINHYGLLFQYNKKWQKKRTRKANLVHCLDSPKEFRTFFENEVDEIGASLGRIAELLDRADQDFEREKILHDTDFQKNFAILLRQVKALNDAIQLFNQDLLSKGL